MNIMEFNRRLMDAGLSPQANFLMGYLYERISILDESMVECGKVLEGMVKTIENYARVNDQLIASIKKLQRGGIPDGVEVHSVRPDPDDV